MATKLSRYILILGRGFSTQAFKSTSTSCFLVAVSGRVFHVIDLFLDSDSFYNSCHISLVNVQTNYCNNNLLILDVKQLNKIMKLYYFYTLKALSDSQGKIKMY